MHLCSEAPWSLLTPSSSRWWPSVFDIWAAEDVFSVIDELTTGRSVDTRVVLNQVTPTIIAKEALQSLQVGLKERGIVLMVAVLQNRTAWPRAIGEGMGVGEWEPAGKAAQELYQLARELELYVDENTTEA